MQWHWIDLAIISIILLSILTGLFRGFVKELIALGVWAAGLWVAFHYSHHFNPLLQNYIQDDTSRSVVTFTSLLITTVFIGAVFNSLLGFLLKRSGLSGTDRLLGMVFGFVRGIFIVGLMMVVIKMTSMPYQQYSAQSKFYAHFDPMVNWLSGLMPNVIKQVKSIIPNQEIVSYIDEIQVS